MIYFDHAATTLPKPPCVIHAVADAMNRSGSLGRGGHSAAQLASETALRCRELAGELFDLSPERVVFTFNTTHGLNIAIRSLVERGDKVVVSGFEHNAVMRPLYDIGAQILVAGKRLFDPQDTVMDFERLIDNDVKAVICTHVSNVFGYILPIEEIGQICYKANIPLIVDAAQSAGVLPISAKKLHAAFVAIPGHKGLYGPQGTGLLLCGAVAKPILFGGTGSASLDETMPSYLPDMLEAGTQNIHGIAGLAAGLQFIKEKTLKQISDHERGLMNMIISELSRIDKLTIFRGDIISQIGALSIVPKLISAEELGERLREQGIAVRTGYQCAPLAHKSANTLDTGTLRISVSAMSTQSEAEQLIDCILSQNLI